MYAHYIRFNSVQFSFLFFFSSYTIILKFTSKPSEKQMHFLCSFSPRCLTFNSFAFLGQFSRIASFYSLLVVLDLTLSVRLIESHKCEHESKNGKNLKWMKPVSIISCFDDSFFHLAHSLARSPTTAKLSGISRRARQNFFFIVEIKSFLLFFCVFSLTNFSLKLKNFYLKATMKAKKFSVMNDETRFRSSR